MGQVCEKCLSTSQVCPDCGGKGMCRDCGGKGTITLEDRQCLKTEYRKGPGGEKIPEVITTLIKGDIRFCAKCGGWGDKAPGFRGNSSGGPVDYGHVSSSGISVQQQSSPPRGKPGTGKCHRCAGTGKTTTPLIPVERKLKF
mmetsp:Transcript_66090/g.131078  ORF Transcript_66090/g.131078 Transcript_66090/m.131078 type:complete len:142 (-) Transcript_66090:310-735(-)|eukprot:CAMPEP_0174729148 /NCGR_PEP_ID=MMETSP1094-20130205/53135_1 /TAXON_ID=156173 /ORGANISM="Chrysochromulina brevifilum, Strain UTEX LB 985" /LENGTH=141 /DNA_ID=CAMNT_0015931201 /DNA_START=75 /DNA_END=500 /DNA_ORIENTATION=+